MCLSKKIREEEIIVRTIFSDLVKNQKGDLKPNAFKSFPVDKDEVSVTRFSYTDAFFCKSLRNHINKGGYCGLASIWARKIYEVEANIVYTPTKINFFHSDIKIGIEIKPGVTVHPYYTEKIKNLAKSAKFHNDTCLHSENWCGDEILPNI